MKQNNNNYINNINNNNLTNKPQNKHNFTSKQQSNLNNLEKKLLQKIYYDCFSLFPETFQSNNLTFENFIFQFSQEIHLLYNFNSPSYNELLNKVNELIIKKFPSNSDLKNFSPLQLKKYFYNLKLNDDWNIINKYQNEIFKEEENKKLKEIANNMKKYFNDLKQQ